MRTTTLLATILVAACSATGVPDPGGAEQGGNGVPDLAAGGQDDLPDLEFGGGTAGGLMKLAVIGDCRPPGQNGTASYPSTVLGGVFTRAQQLGAQFVVGTGDYIFADNATDVAKQIALFKQAASNYSAGPIYLTLGNHECDGLTSSNCPNLNETPNIQAFMANLAPPGASKPYFRLDVPTPFGKAKFLFVAANAWDALQQSWLQRQLADSTTYTFVVRHEPISDNKAPGVNPSEDLVTQAKLTLELNGHEHEYRRTSTNHVTSGNAGAPLNSGGDGYGLLLIEQTDAGDITAQEVDEATGNVTDTWTVTADGAAR